MRLIDEQQAIDALMERFKRVPTNAIIAKDVIEKLPSVQPGQRWIPCNERLPEDVEEGQEYPTVIYSTSSGEVAAGWYEVLTRTWWRESASDDVIEDKVIAWMPLPKPYKEGDTT